MKFSRFSYKFIASLILGIGIVGAGTALFITHSASALSGADWQAGKIIDDGTFYNSGDMSVGQVQAFLNAQVPTCDTWGTQTSEYGGGTRAQYGTSVGYPPPYICLKDYYENPTTHANNLGTGTVPSGAISAAQIIVNAAQTYGVSVRALLVTLQKESAGPLITDTWPFPSQYTNAMGYGCPDTAPCDPSYAGFYNQVTNAARQFQLYKNNPTSYRYVPGRNNTILYNPNSACGSSTVYIQDFATAGLYNYTPYQPNQAALNNLYGSGDSCSAYGNRNFWRIFNDWFGSTTGSVSLVRSTSDPTVYVLSGTQIFGVPSPDVLNAWGLGNMPVTTISDASLAVFTNSGVLGRVVKNPNNPSMLLLADNGGYFNAWPSMVQDYGFDPNSAINVGQRLLTVADWSANLSPFITTPGGSGVYLVDNGSYHLFSSPANLGAWAGSNPPVVGISNALFNQLTASSAGIFGNDAALGSGSHYLLDNGQAYSVPTALTSAYTSPNPLAVSQNLINVLPSAGTITQFVKSSSSSTIYFVDAYTRYGFTSIDLLTAFSNNNVPQVTTLTDDALGRLTTGNNITSHFVYNSTTGTPYYLQNHLTGLGTAFGGSAYALPLSTSTLANYSTSSNSLDCGSGNGFVQASGDATIYMLENGQKRPIRSIDDFLMLDASQKVCVLSQADVNAIPTGALITPFVNDNGALYVLDGVNRYTTSTAQLQAMGVTTTSTTIDTTIANYTDQGALSNTLKLGGSYAFVSGSNYYTTSSSAVATIWNITAPQAHSQAFANHLNYGGALSQFAQSTDSTDKTVYLVDGGKFLPVGSMAALFNAGYAGQHIPTILASIVTANPGPLWQGYLATDGTNTWVLDGGQKRGVPSQYLSQWVGTQTPTTLSSSFLSLLSSGGSITDAVRTSSDPTVYGLKEGNRYGVSSPSVYTQSGLGSIVIISNNTMQLIPSGGIWTN